MVEFAENLRSDLNRFLSSAAASEWRTFLGHLDLHRGFGVFILLLPARAGASLCEGVLRQNLLTTGRDLDVLRFESADRISELPTRLLEMRSDSTVGAVWVDLLGTALVEDSAWQGAVRRALAALNQQRNQLARNLSVPLIFVGEVSLQNALREAAPDLWTVRIAVERLDDALAGAPHESLLQTNMSAGEIVPHAAGGAADPDYALEQARKLSADPAFVSPRVKLLLRAASGFHDQRRYALAEATAVECLTLLTGSGSNSALRAQANSLLSLARSGLGRRAEALAPAQEAVDLRRALALQQPDAFTPALAGSLNNLANRLSALGRRADALAPAQEAVDHYRVLARQQPDAFTPALASSLNNMANRLSELGRRADALALAQEAVDLHRALARQLPDAFTPALATSLNNLANRLSELGRRADALAPAQEAVDLRRALARQQPDAFTPDLALSLNNLANRLSDLGRRADALAPAQEAVNLRRALARQQPDAFTPALAMSLNNLAIRLSELGRSAEALAQAQEAVDLYRALARQQPDAFTPDLAQSLNNLAVFLSELGRRADALVPAQEAVDLRRALALQQPDAFTPDLAQSLAVMGRTLETNERPTEALAHFAEGVALLTPALQALPAAHAPLMSMLAKAYLRLAEALGQEPDMALLAPVVEVLQKLQAANEAPPTPPEVA